MHDHLLAELLLVEVRAAMEKERARALAEARRLAHQELDAAVKQAKSKQWWALGPKLNASLCWFPWWRCVRADYIEYPAHNSPLESVVLVSSRQFIILMLYSDCDSRCLSVCRCANCSQEAQFYCCWNTSYCDYPCQRAHWAQHYGSCTQQRTSVTTIAGLIRYLEDDKWSQERGYISRIVVNRLLSVYLYYCCSRCKN